MVWICCNYYHFGPYVPFQSTIGTPPCIIRIKFCHATLFKPSITYQCSSYLIIFYEPFPKSPSRFNHCNTPNPTMNTRAYSYFTYSYSPYPASYVPASLHISTKCATCCFRFFLPSNCWNWASLSYWSLYYTLLRT